MATPRKGKKVASDVRSMLNDAARIAKAEAYLSGAAINPRAPRKGPHHEGSAKCFKCYVDHLPSEHKSHSYPRKKRKAKE